MKGYLLIKIVIAIFVHLLPVSGQFYGTEIGPLIASPPTAQRATGTVYSVDARSIFIKDFTFDGSSVGTDARFFAGSSESPDDTGVIIPDEQGTTSSLRDYNGEDIVLTLPDNTEITDFLWIAVWDAQLQVAYGFVLIPEGFLPPTIFYLGEFGYSPRVHNVHADDVIIENTRQITFQGFDYDGQAPDVYIWTGEGTPDASDIRVADKNGNIDRELPAYNGGTFTITLPENLTVFDIDFIGVWCETLSQDFGYLAITDEDRANIPPFIAERPQNCVELIENRFQVAWQLDERSNTIYLELSGRIALNEYMSFGISGSGTATEVSSSDVTLAWINQDTREPQAEDYTPTFDFECLEQFGFAFGICPDTLSQDGSNDVVLLGTSFRDGVFTISFERYLSTDDQLDIPIPTDQPVFISWGLGFFNEDGLASSYQTTPEGDVQINFGATGLTCPDFTPLINEEELEPWTIEPLITEGADTFTAIIGPAGGARGYEGITDTVGCGSAWYINGSLIPEITVQRGSTYRFEVFGGADSNISASYNPFYITDSSGGGFGQKSPEEMMMETIYAGPAEGALCEYQSTYGVDPNSLASFEEFFETLTLNCSDEEPGILIWTVAADTPDTVYYQSYMHPYLGWRISVVGEGPVDTPNPCDLFPCFNDGTCMPLGGTNFMCVCPAGFSGNTCEERADPCDPSPCRNNGVCFPERSIFICICQEGFSGTLCEEDLNAALSTPSVFSSPPPTPPPSPRFTFPTPGVETTDIVTETVVVLDTVELTTDIGTDVDTTILTTGATTSGDTNPPIITNCPSDITEQLESESALFAFASWDLPTAEDGEGGVVLMDGPDNEFNFFAEGTSPVVYVFADDAGNTAVCSFNVIIVPFDPEPPLPCDSNPCMNGGSCVVIVTAFLCVCPQDFTGQDCSVPINTPPSVPVCPSVPAVTSLSGNIGNTVTWTIDDCTDAEDLTITPECDAMSGDMFDVGSTPVVCTCTDSGSLTSECSFNVVVNPETSSVPCGSIECFNGGSCLDLSLFGFGSVCMCPPGYTGETCSVEIVTSPCIPNPCMNNGLCIEEDDGASFTCECTLSFMGDRCEVVPRNCDELQCANGGTCVEFSSTFAACMCADGFSGPTCADGDAPLNCDELQCENGGTCTDFFGALVLCTCPAGFSGPTCGVIDVDLCATVVCLNGGTCDPTRPEGSRCVCPPDYTGPFCEVMVSPCDSSPCLNDGVCITEDGGAGFRCECILSFMGDRCQDIPLSCDELQCENGGSCTEITGSLAFCSCLDGFSGPTCGVSDVDPCATVVCLNGGTCELTRPEGSRCVCPPDYTGPFCEVMVSPCDSNPCMNDGSCITEDGGTGFRCECTLSFMGDRCQDVPLSCDELQCENGGSCTEIFATLAFCVCPDGFNGPTCGVIDVSLCATVDCLNGGTCDPTRPEGSRCVCPPDFTGPFCEVMVSMSPCDPNPCMNDGSCIIEDGGAGFRCECPLSFMGDMCEVAPRSCEELQCENGGTCSAVFTLAFCICPDGFDGPTCAIGDDVIALQCLNLPDDISVEVEFGTPGANLFWTEPTCRDSSGTAAIASQTHRPGDFFNVGQTSVSYTCVDATGNTETCSFFVSVQAVDTTPPECVNLPQDISQFIELGTSSTQVFWVEPTCSDVTGTGFIASQSHMPGDTFSVGETAVSYTCEDASRNNATCTFFVVIIQVDTTPPQCENLPEDISMPLELGTANAQIFWEEPTCSDISGTGSITSQSHMPGDTFDIGQTEVLYICADASANTAFCSFNVVIFEDHQIPPTISNCPGNITNTIELGEVGAVITWTEPTATDISGIVALTSRSHQPPSFFFPGATQVMYVFSDINGNAATCTFMVIITEIDTTPPTIFGCPADMEVTIEFGNPGMSVTWTEPTATDLSGTETLQSRSHAPPSFFLVGDTLVTYTFVDTSGNTADCAFTITVTPGGPCQNNPCVPPSTCAASNGDFLCLCQDNQYGDFCQETFFSLESSPTRFNDETGTLLSPLFPSPSPDRLFSNFFIVQVPEARSIEFVFDFFCTEPDKDFLYYGVGNSPSVAALPSTEGVSFFNGGQTIERGTVTCDSALPNPFTIEGDSAWFRYDTDQGIMSRGFNLSYTVDPDDCNPNPCQNGGICDDLNRNYSCMCLPGFEGRDCEIISTMPPFIACPAPVVVTTQVNNVGNTATWDPPACVDAEDGTITTSVCVPMSGSFFTGVGVNTVTCTCTDSGGLSDECTFSVTIEDSEPTLPCDSSPCQNGGTCFDTVFDAVNQFICVCPEEFTGPNCSLSSINTPPVITCPGPVTVTSQANNVGNSATWDPPTCVDTEDGTITTSVCVPMSGSFFPGVGVNTVTCTCTDSGGLSDECTFSVTIEGTSSVPCGSIECFNGGTCLDLSEFGFPSQCICPPDYTGATCLDEVDQVTFPCNPNPCLNGGTCIEEDDGISFTCECMLSFMGDRCQVLVDVAPPVIECGQDIVRETPISTGGLQVNFAECTATDDSGTAILVSRSHSPGQFFVIGQTVVTYTFTDPTGNTATGSFNVIVNGVDDSPPRVECGPDITRETPMATGGLQVNFEECTATDDSGTAILLSRSSSPGQFFPIGSTEVVYTFTDPTGNTATGSFTITVVGVDDSPPRVECGPDITRETPMATGGLQVNFEECTATDDSGTAILVSRSNSPGQFFPIGSTEVVYTFTDPTGNTATGSFTITVVGGLNTPPVIFCPVPLIVTSMVNNVGNTATWDPPTCVDAEDGIITTSMCVPMSGSFFGVGVNTVNCTCTDSRGLSDGCTFSVTIEERDPCDSAPCLNGGTCFRLDSINFFCQCADGFSGITCEIEINPCDPAPCLNGGTCFPLDSTNFFCQCPTGFLGNICQTVVNPCDAIPCQNGATCVPGLGPNFTCQCPVGFSGSDCGEDSEPTLPCDSSPCQNGGTCFDLVSDLVNQFICVCSEEFTGQDCSVSRFNTPPVITCPGPVTVTSQANNVGNSATWDPPTCVDTEDRTITTSSCEPMPGTFFPGVGVNTVTCTCTDSGGLSDECTFSVTIEDSEPALPCDSSPCQNGGTCFDLVFGAVNQFICVCPEEFTGQDCSMSTSNAPPVITCPEPVTVTSQANNVGNSATWDPPTCVDAEDGTITTSACEPMSGLFFLGVGVNTVNCTCTDSGGLSDECTFPVTIVGLDVPPVITCPDPVTVTSQASNVGNTAAWDEPSCSGADDGSITISLCVPMSGSFFGVGENTVTCTCTDSGGLSDECTFPVTVEDVTPDPCDPSPCLNDGTCFPLGGTNFFCSCPAGYSGDTCEVDDTPDPCDPSPCFNDGTCFPLGGTNFFCSCPAGYSGDTCEVDDTPDPCDPSPCLNDGTCFSLGGTNFFCSCPAGYSGDTCEVVLDPCSLQPCINNGTCVPNGPVEFFCICTFQFIGDTCDILDVAPPTVLSCPQDMTVFVESLGDETQGQWTEPTAIDNSEIPVIVSASNLPSDSFSIGFYDVMYNFADNAGNTADCQFEFNVAWQLDTDPPQIFNCPSGPVMEVLPLETLSIPVSWSPPIAFDIAGPTRLTSTHTPGDSFPEGSTLVQYSFEDTAGLETGCSFLVVVVPTFNPCRNNPCQNGGICNLRDGAIGFSCDCSQTSFTGPTCTEIVRRTCFQNPCQNGGLCFMDTSKPTGFTCDCPSTFTGLLCNQYAACTPTLCENGAVCVNGVGIFGFTCICPAPFSGTFCEIEESPCGPGSCLNNAICITDDTRILGYRCLCQGTFTGPFCGTQALSFPNRGQEAMQEISLNGRDAVITCTVATDSVDVRWFFNSMEIMSGPKYIISFGRLRIRAVNAGDIGTYTCEITFNGQSSSMDITVTVAQ
ncbi:Hyalin [Holothuria leucospilota]|uniref:Hyalin n=1 Tax=Holothuria leucospilota TaxID=206669 RepID=A0A9Q1C919_HOLLE|nr:Hyalin [Holothuria leucospilota]